MGEFKKLSNKDLLQALEIQVMLLVTHYTDERFQHVQEMKEEVLRRMIGVGVSPSANHCL